MRSSRARARYCLSCHLQLRGRLVHSLRNRALTESWGDVVTVVPHDMRTWRAPEQVQTALRWMLLLFLMPHVQADVLVSELLGSFGDNELSPECLDGAQRFLRPGARRCMQFSAALGCVYVCV